MKMSRRKQGDESGSINIDAALFPFGPPKLDSEKDRMFDLYKIMVTSSESLVGRRQGLNTFFLTLNGVLISAIGLFVRIHGQAKVTSSAVFTLSLVGFVLANAWKSLITSFGQLNRGKFEVISRIEQLLPVAIFAAEWKALAEGKNPKIYRTFTDKEVWVPKIFTYIYLMVMAISLSIAIGFWTP